MLHTLRGPPSADLASALPLLLRLLRRAAATASSSCSNKAAAAMETTTVAMTASSQQQQTPTAAAAAHFYRRALPSNCLAFGSPEGKRIFREAMEAGYMEGYFALASQYRTQDDLAFCGLATLVMCLNSLEVDPGKVWKGPWRWFHEEMLDCCVPVDRVRRLGLTLAEFACLAGCNSLLVRRLVQPSAEDDDTAGFAKFDAVVRECCSTDGQVLVASYSRLALGQTGDGHFAPVGGYHPGRQLVLLFDTARFKYPPHWVPLRQLWDALKLPDSATGRPRGYCVLAKARGLAAIRVTHRFTNEARSPDSPMVRLARDFYDWLAATDDGVDVGAPTNGDVEDGVGAGAPTNGVGTGAPTNGNAAGKLQLAEAVAVLTLAARQLGILWERHQPADFVLSRQPGASHDSEEVLSALESLPARAPVAAEFCTAAGSIAVASRRIADSPADCGSVVLLALLTWPLTACGCGGVGRLTRFAAARERLLAGASDGLATEVGLLRKQLAVIFDAANLTPRDQAAGASDAGGPEGHTASSVGQ